MYHFHIADDHPLFRKALLEVIHQQFNAITINESSDFETTISALEQKPDIDLLLLDLYMPGNQDLYGLIIVRERFPSIPVAVISANENADIINRAIGHGASAYIPKSSPANLLHDAIQTVINGDTWLLPHIRLSTNLITKEEKDLANKIASLTPQQYKVLCYLREGRLNKQIGYELGVTEATIKAHITAIFRKLGANNRTQAVVMLSQLSLEKDNNTPPYSS